MTERVIRLAAMGIVYAIIFADDKVVDAEQVWLRDVASGHPLFAEASEDELRAILTAVHTESRSGSLLHAAERWARQIPPEWASSIFELAVRAAFADGKLAEDEGHITIHVRELLGIPLSEATKIYREVRGA